MQNIEDLKNRVKELQQELKEALYAQSAFEAMPENNVFDSLEEADKLKEILYARASADCEGSYNCGEEQYVQDFIVDIEYNRHDKTYYYVDEFKYSVVKI